MTLREQFEQLYLVQDQVLKFINELDTEFYLTGGTALSRAYLHHRYSDDLDLFVNDDQKFELYVDRIIHKLFSQPGFNLEVQTREERYVRLNLDSSGEVALKLEFVNDVPSRVGEIVDHHLLGRIDTAENIFAYKITAVLSREEPKDIADIWGLCNILNLSIQDAIIGASSKAAGIFPPDLARVFYSATSDDWEVINWIKVPDPKEFIQELNKIGESLLLVE